MKNLLSFILALCLCLCSVFVLISCNGEGSKIEESETQTVDTEEISNEETEEITDAPTEKITEPQETDITINGVVFDSVLKSKLKSAQTYGEICDLLKCEGELVEAPEIVYEWLITDENNKTKYLWVNFKFTEDGFVVCEDYRETAEKLQLSRAQAQLSDEISNQITPGKSLEEIVSLLQSKWELLVGDRPCYRWSNEEQGITIDVYLRQYYGSFNGGEVPDNINEFEIAFIDLGDGQNANNMAEDGMLKLKAGQSISEIQEILDIRAISLASGIGYTFDFDDGSKLICYTYRNPYFENDNGLDSTIFIGYARIP